MNARGELWAVLPVKGFGRGKSRLGAVLSDPVRVAFARSLFEHVLATMSASACIAQVVVLTDDDEVAAMAAARGADVLRDASAATLSQIVDAGLLHACKHGARAALVCMADLPLLSAEDLSLVAERIAECPVVLAPDAAEAGTNLLALSPPNLFPSRFGNRDSFAQHRACALQNGHEPAVIRTRGLCFDVDDPRDLEQLD